MKSCRRAGRCRSDEALRLLREQMPTLRCITPNLCIERYCSWNLEQGQSTGWCIHASQTTERGTHEGT
ncbi:hypothetical protein EMIT047CA2_30242 [Pseudomonas soli]